MKIINNIEIDNPNQWIERFVEQVLENAGIDCEQALIEEIEEEKRILLSAGGQRYDIRIQAFLPVAADLMVWYARRMYSMSCIGRIQRMVGNMVKR